MEPVVVDDPVDEELEMVSDDELIAEVGELEDNFVELAGGKRVRLDDDEDGDEHEEKPVLSTSSLPLHKVKMFRFT